MYGSIDVVQEFLIDCCASREGHAEEVWWSELEQAWISYEDLSLWYSAGLDELMQIQTKVEGLFRKLCRFGSANICQSCNYLHLSHFACEIIQSD